MYRDLLRPAPAGEGLGRRACHGALATVRGRTPPQVLSEIETRAHEGAPRACPSRM